MTAMQRQKLRSNLRKKFGHRNGRSSCAHSIGKFFLCYIVLFSFETSATGSPGNYLYKPVNPKQAAVFFLAQIDWSKPRNPCCAAWKPIGKKSTPLSVNWGWAPLGPVVVAAWRRITPLTLVFPKIPHVTPGQEVWKEPLRAEPQVGVWGKKTPTHKVFGRLGLVSG